MKHIRIIPDCPVCGKELSGRSKGLPPYTNKRPYGSSFEVWYECSCGHESAHVVAPHRDEALKILNEAEGAKEWTEAV